MAFVIGGTAGALVGSGLLGLGSSLISSGAANSAAQKQADAANQASQLQYQEFQQQQANQKPWLQAGQQALSQMQDPYFQHDFSMADYQADPGYQFRLQQGQQALERSAAARGGLMSGGTLKDLTNYAQGAASQEYQNAYNRFTNNQSNRFNRLASLAGFGQTANAQLGQAGQNYADNVGSIGMGAARAQGAAGIAGANAFGNTLSSLGNNWMQYSMMKNWLGGGGSGGGGGSAYSYPGLEGGYQLTGGQLA